MFGEIRGLGLLLGCVLQTGFCRKSQTHRREAWRRRDGGAHRRRRRGAFCASTLNVSDEEIARA